MFVLGKYGKLFGVTLLSTLIIVGCGGGDDGSESAGSSATSSGAVVENPVDPSTAGNISGSVAFEGSAPAMDAIDMSAEPVCADKHANTPMAQSVVVNDNGTLGNVFVYVKEGSAIGACSLLKTDTLPWSIYYGVPARFKKKRKKIFLNKTQDI